jgi:hypothetical protein
MFVSKGDAMKIGRKTVNVFKIKNRAGYAAVCEGHLTEGVSHAEACERMAKALSRTSRLGCRRK